MTTAPATARPRRPDDPVVVRLRLAHRCVLRDADRLVEAAERVAAGRVAVDHRRATAVARRVRDWADAVSAHHRFEDELLWPVLLASAGPHVDLSELRDDRACLAPALERVRTAGAALGAVADEDRATSLAVELGELRDALREHVREQEGAVLPLLERDVAAADRQRLGRAMARRARLAFELPRAAALLTGQERRALSARDRLLLRLGSALLGWGFRRRERLALG